MSNVLKYTCTFVIGAAVGAFIAKKYITRHDDYEYYNEEKNDAAEKSVDNIKENKSDAKVEHTDAVSDLKSVYRADGRVDYNRIKTNADKERKEYKDMLEDMSYASPDKPPMVETIPSDPTRPYNISPDEYLALDDYDSDSFTYYADGYVTDSLGMPMSAEDIESSLGFGFESYFGSYDDDEIWIRNERLKMDFSVARDIERFQDCAPDRIKRMVGMQ